MSTPNQDNLPPDYLQDDLWTTQTPYRYPIPKRYEELSTPQRDPWFILYDAKRREESGFLATTYKDLQTGPEDETVFLLRQIALRMEVVVGAAKSSDIPPLSLTPPTTITPSLTRIHTTWFLSLVLSLSMAAIGILCLQWIREYERANTDISFKQAFALQSMRRESFKQWRVPDIIASLPIFLQIALGLFFLGMVDFLLPLGASISLPTVTIIALILLLAILTTFAPAVQTLTLLRKGFKSIPLPSPYKSPQAWRVLMLIYQLMRAAAATRHLFEALFHAPWIHFRHRENATQHYTWRAWLNKLMLCLREAFKSHYAHQFLFDEEWKTDVFWMGERNSQYSSETSLDTEWTVRFRADWDAARGLAYVMDHTSLADLLPSVIYHCFDELPASLDEPFFESLATLHIVDEYNYHFQSRRLLPLWQDPPSALQQIEYKVLLLNSLTVTHAPKLDHLVLRHQFELFIRLLSGIYTGPWMVRRPGAVDRSLNTSTFRPRLLRRGETRKFLCMTGSEEGLVQLARVFHTFASLSIERSANVRLNQHHGEKDIAYLVELLILSTEEFAVASVNSHKKQPAALFLILSILAETQKSLLRFLTNTSGARDLATFTDRIELAFVVACQLLRYTWYYDLLPVVQRLDGQQVAVIQSYTSSLGLLLQWCDALLPRMQVARESMDGFDSAERLILLNKLGLAPISLVNKRPSETNLLEGHSQVPPPLDAQPGHQPLHPEGTTDESEVGGDIPIPSIHVIQADYPLPYPVSDDNSPPSIHTTLGDFEASDDDPFDGPPQPIDETVPSLPPATPDHAFSTTPVSLPSPTLPSTPDPSPHIIVDVVVESDVSDTLSQPMEVPPVPSLVGDSKPAAVL